MKLLEALAASLIVLILITATVLCLNLVNFVKTDTKVIVSQAHAKAHSPVVIEVPSFNKYDRVYLILDASMPIYDVAVIPEGSLIPLPLDVEGIETDVRYPILLTKHFFFVANASGTARLVLYMQPKAPYAIKDLEGRTRFEVFSYDEDGEEYVGIDLEVVEFAQNGFTQTLLILPLNEVIQPDFQVRGKLKLLQGKIAYVNFMIMTDVTWYAFNIAPSTLRPNSNVNFNVNAGSRELLGRTGEFLGKKGLFVAIGIGLCNRQFGVGEVPRATLAIGDITITNGGKKMVMKSQLLHEYELPYRLYIFRKFQPTGEHFLLVSALISEVLAFSYAAIELWRRRDEHTARTLQCY